MLVSGTNGRSMASAGQLGKSTQPPRTKRPSTSSSKPVPPPSLAVCSCTCPDSSPCRCASNTSCSAVHSLRGHRIDEWVSLSDRRQQPSGGSRPVSVDELATDGVQGDPWTDTADVAHGAHSRAESRLCAVRVHWRQREFSLRQQLAHELNWKDDSDNLHQATPTLPRAS